MRSTLVLGGARSGKSRYAEGLVAASGKSKIYIATGQARDAEMGERIAMHQAQRGQGWQTFEAPLDIVSPILAAQAGQVLLVDCLTLWLSNLMEGAHSIAEYSGALTAAIEQTAGELVLVSNEVGLGIVPDNKLAREFRDHAGRLNQQVAAACEHVVFVAAGLPMVLKGHG